MCTYSMESQLLCFWCVLVCSLGMGSLGRGEPGVPSSGQPVPCMLPRLRGIWSLLQLLPCTVWAPLFLALKFNCARSQAPWLTLQNQIGLLSNCLIFFWVIPCNPFYQNTFLFSDLNVHFDPRTCLWQWRCGHVDHGADGYQSLLSALSSWKCEWALAVMVCLGMDFSKGVQIH